MDERETAMEPDGVYLYCFARRGRVGDIRLPGIDGREDIAALEAGAVTAVFSRVPLDGFSGRDAEANLQDLAWVAPRACQHERVVEEVMRFGPVVPVRFGTVFSSQQPLERLLAEKGEQISRILDWVSDKEEWAVKGLVDTPKAREWLTAADPVLAERRRRLPDAPGARYLQQRQLDAEAEKALTLWQSAAAEQIRDEIRHEAVDVCPLKLQPQSGREGDREMTLNLAVLVLRDRLPEFHARAEAISAAYAEQGLSVGVSGPWPPYNFCPPSETRQNETLGVLRSS